KCEDCAANKLTKPSFKNRPRVTTSPLQVVYSDLCGPFPDSFASEKYFMTVIDDYSRFCVTYFLKSKDQALDCFKIFVNWAETQIGHKVKQLFTDNGGEFVNNRFEQFLSSKGIEHHTTSA